MEQQQGKQFSLLSWNIHHGATPDLVYNFDKAVAFIAEVLATRDGEVICLQEVDNAYSERSNNDEQPRLFAEKLALQDFRFYDSIKDSYGLAILSPKSQIVQSEKYVLSTKEENFSSEERIMGRASLQNGVEVFNLHLSNKPEQRQLRIKEIQRALDVIENIRKVNKHVVVCGDFNSQLNIEVELREELVRKGFKLLTSQKQQPPTRTFKNFDIDYIWVPESAQIENFEVIDCRQISDHNLIYGKWKFTEQ